MIGQEYLKALERNNNLKLRNLNIFQKHLKDAKLGEISEPNSLSSGDNSSLLGFTGDNSSLDIERYKDDARYLLSKYISDVQFIDRIINSLSDAQIKELVLHFSDIESNYLKINQKERIDKNEFIEKIKDLLNDGLKKHKDDNIPAPVMPAAPPAQIPQTPIPTTPPTNQIIHTPITPMQPLNPPSSSNIQPSPISPSNLNQFSTEVSDFLSKFNLSKQNYSSLVEYLKNPNTIDEREFVKLNKNITLPLSYDEYSNLSDQQKNVKKLPATMPNNFLNKIELEKRIRKMNIGAIINLAYFISLRGASSITPKSIFSKSGHGIHQLGDKYYVEKHKFDNGLLELRYLKNKHLTNIKPQHMTQNLHKIMHDIIHHKNFDLTDYHKLHNFDKNIVRLMNEKIGLGVNIHGDDSLDKEFQLIRGEILAGNNNQQLLQKAKRYILHAMSINKIPRNVGYDLMNELNC